MEIGNGRGLNEGENLEIPKNWGLNDVSWEMEEVSHECNYPEHFLDNHFFFFFRF